MAIIDSVKLPDNSTYEVADNHSGYQKQTLTTPITINGTQKTNVEGALGGLNDYGNALADNLAANENVYGAKNLISYPFYETTKTESGLTFTDNGDGTITIGGGVSSAAVAFTCSNYNKKIKKGTYKLTGCPQGGGMSSYYFYFYSASLSPTSYFDTGNGIEFTIPNDINDGYIGITITNGIDLTTPITFKPMIRDARVVDDTFAPYAMTNKQLTDELERTKHHKIYESAQYTATTADAWEYTGVSITIPAKTFFGIQGVTFYVNSMSTGVALNMDSSVFYGYNCWAIEQSANGVGKCSICGYTPTAQTLYLWAKCSVASSENGYEISGWYIYE